MSQKLSIRPHQGLLLLLLLSIPALVLANAGPEASPKAKAQNDEYPNGVNYDNYNPDYVDENYGKCVILLFKKYKGHHPLALTWQLC